VQKELLLRQRKCCELHCSEVSWLEIPQIFGRLYVGFPNFSANQREDNHKINLQSRDFFDIRTAHVNLFLIGQTMETPTLRRV